ncbi:hypothetical protein ACJIZ3_012853 [Penstemon smallii]|uniref:BZIP domain-containing protein n=1 Tax=Penstemon smallii TaxID=265156 RepID=A0ABD3UN98_9LAMI
MEPITTNADNRQEIDDLIGKLEQGSDDLWEKLAQLTSSGIINVEELLDLYNSYCGDNSYSTSGSTQEQTTAGLQDFNNYESTNIENINGLNTNTEIQENEMMFEEMAEDASEEYAAVNTNSHAGMGSTNNSKEVIYIKYGDLHCSGAGGSELGRILGGPFMNFPQKVRVNKEVSNSKTMRNRIKRKYGGVVETAEETARRLEITKIKNREAATKAQEARKEREELLRARMSMIQRKNEYLKKVIKAMDNSRRINQPQKPLRRTKSGPQ